MKANEIINHLKKNKNDVTRMIEERRSCLSPSSSNSNASVISFCRSNNSLSLLGKSSLSNVADTNLNYTSDFDICNNLRRKNRPRHKHWRFNNRTCSKISLNRRNSKQKSDLYFNDSGKSSFHEPIEEESKEYTPSKTVIGSRDNPIINSPTGLRHNFLNQERINNGPKNNKESLRKGQESIHQRIKDVKNNYNQEAVRDMDGYFEVHMSSKSSSFWMDEQIDVKTSNSPFSSNFRFYFIDENKSPLPIKDVKDINGSEQIEWPVKNQQPSSCENDESQSFVSDKVIEVLPDSENPMWNIETVQNGTEVSEEHDIEFQIAEKNRKNTNLNDLQPDINASRNFGKSLSLPIDDRKPVNSFESKVPAFTQNISAEDIDAPDKPTITSNNRSTKDPDPKNLNLKPFNNGSSRFTEFHSKSSLYITEQNVKQKNANIIAEQIFNKMLCELDEDRGIK